MGGNARAAYLDAACAGDRELRAEVEELLSLDTGGVSTVAAGAVQGAARAVSTDQEQGWIGRRVGAWEITGVLGRGGMGAVYEVERADGAYRQRAAMKLMRREWSVADGERRFAEERQILAQLEHPNIARLLDGGSTAEGLPFLVMEVVDGLPIHRYAAEAKLGIEERLRLVVTVASAAHAAHRKLVIHRDLKPANILVTADGMVKLLDFGIARLAQPAAAAEDPGELLFSSAFASPEQLNGDPVSTASDVYSLGAILFELLTGQPPRAAAGASLYQLRAAAARPIPSPSAAAPAPWRRRLRGDLDCIVGRATHPDPAARYESAERFAADLERHLAGRPVGAHPGGYVYRSRKYLRRHAAAVALAACAVAGLVATTVNSVVQARRAERRFTQVRHLAKYLPLRRTRQYRATYKDRLGRGSRSSARRFNISKAWRRKAERIGGWRWKWQPRTTASEQSSIFRAPRAWGGRRMRAAATGRRSRFAESGCGASRAVPRCTSNRRSPI